MTTVLISSTRQKSTLLASRYPALASPRGSYPTPRLPPGNLPGLPAAKQLPGQGSEPLLTGGSHGSSSPMLPMVACIMQVQPGTLPAQLYPGHAGPGHWHVPMHSLKISKLMHQGKLCSGHCSQGQTMSPQPLHLPFILSGSGAVPAGCHHSPWPQVPGANG